MWPCRTLCRVVLCVNLLNQHDKGFHLKLILQTKVHDQICRFDCCQLFITCAQTLNIIQVCTLPILFEPYATVTNMIIALMINISVCQNNLLWMKKKTNLVLQTRWHLTDDLEVSYKLCYTVNITWSTVQAKSFFFFFLGSHLLYTFTAEDSATWRVLLLLVPCEIPVLLYSIASVYKFLTFGAMKLVN